MDEEGQNDQLLEDSKDENTAKTENYTQKTIDLKEGDSIFVLARMIKLVYQDRIEKLKKESKNDAFDFKPELDDIECFYSDDDA